MGGHSWSHHSSFVGGVLALTASVCQLRTSAYFGRLFLWYFHFGIRWPTTAAYVGRWSSHSAGCHHVLRWRPFPSWTCSPSLFLGIARRIAPRSIPSSLPSTTTSFLSVPSSVQNFLDCSGCWSLRQQPGAGLQLRGGLLASVKLFPDHGGRAVIVAPARRQVGTVATLREGDAGGREQTAKGQSDVAQNYVDPDGSQSSGHQSGASAPTRGEVAPVHRGPPSLAEWRHKLGVRTGSWLSPSLIRCEACRCWPSRLEGRVGMAAKESYP